MPVKFYLDKRKNKHGESPVRVVWSFNGDRYQTTMGFSIPPRAWDDAEKRVTAAEYNHRKTPVTIMNGFIQSIEKAVNHVENYALMQNATLTKDLVIRVVKDVLAAGGEYPKDKENLWRNVLRERRRNTDRYFRHFKGNKYKLIAYGKDSETLEDVVIYQALYGSNQYWVRPRAIFESTVIDKNGTEVKRFQEISAAEAAK